MTSDPANFDRTLAQSHEERFRALERSLQPTSPPLDIPGYQVERFLGAGAYGQVWVAVETNTGRRVAIKFYAHRGGLDWPLLSREAERLALLFADRYVVQLIDVGWEADPPYFVMEFLEQGSLAERLSNGPLDVQESVDLFRDVAVGLVHAHGKGVLHCDLKPANVLLDQDGKPRLADFGQSRLSHEQTPSLGTLFYMAPEQADAKAVPDARWDVYALGALLYSMLTGGPPYRDVETLALFQQAGGLEEQLVRYRELIARAPRPREHRRQPGVDRELADIVNRCLSTDPHHRYPNPQAVLSALRARESRRARRPLLVLGALGPLVLLLIMAFFGLDAFETAIGESNDALLQRALESDRFAAQFVAATVARSIDLRWKILERAARDPELRELLTEGGDKARGSPVRKRLQQWLVIAQQEHPIVDTASWFVVGARGRQLARSPLKAQTLDQDYSHRDYYHGRGRDFAPGELRVEPLRAPHLSMVFMSEGTHQPTVVLSVPIWEGPAIGEGKVIGVLGQSVGLGHFAELRADERSGNDQLAVLVDAKPDYAGRKGAILEHPGLHERLKHPDDSGASLHVAPEIVKDIENLRQLRRDREPPEMHAQETDALARIEDYRDPAGGKFAGRWLAAIEPVEVAMRPLPSRDTGWAVIVQEPYSSAVEPVEQLRTQLVRQSVMALIVVLLAITALWGFVIVVLNGSPRWRWLARWRHKARHAVSGESSSLSPGLSSENAALSASGAENREGA